MRKKTFINKNSNRKIKKGGEAFISNIIGDKTGYFIPENIPIELENGNKEALLNKYRIKKEDAIAEYSRAKALKDDMTKEDTDFYERNLKFIAKIIMPFLSKLIYYIGVIFKFLVDLGYKLIILGKYLFKQFKSFVWSIITIIRDLFHSRGIIPLVIIFVIIIVVIFSLLFSGKLAPNNPIFKDAGQKIITIKNEMRPESPYGLLTKQLQQIFPIPDDYLQQYNSFMDSFNKFFGKDTKSTDIDSEERVEIKEGRYDGILHIKKAESSDDYIYSIAKPKPVKIDVSESSFQKSDYHKLPVNMQKDDRYNIDRYNIYLPVDTSSSKYSYDMNKAYYYLKTDTTEKPTELGLLNANSKTMPFITSNIISSSDNNNIKSIKTIYNINQIPIDNYIFSNKDSLSEKILKEKLFDFDSSTGKYTYPINYIENERKRKGSLL